jgi:hypothetical protein
MRYGWRVFNATGAFLLRKGTELELLQLALELASSLVDAGVVVPDPPEAIVDERTGTVWLLVPSIGSALGAKNRAQWSETAGPFHSVMNAWADRVELAGGYQNIDEPGADILVTLGRRGFQRFQGKGFELDDKLGTCPFQESANAWRRLQLPIRPAPTGFLRLAGVDIPTLRGPSLRRGMSCDRLDARPDGSAWIARCLGPAQEHGQPARTCLLLERWQDLAVERSQPTPWADARWSRSGQTVLALEGDKLVERRPLSLDEVTSWSIALADHVPRQLTLSPDGARAAVVSTHVQSWWGRIQMVSLEQGTVTLLAPGLHRPVCDTEFLPDGTLVLPGMAPYSVECSDPGCTTRHGRASISRVLPGQRTVDGLPLDIAVLARDAGSREPSFATLMALERGLVLYAPPWEPVLVVDPSQPGTPHSPEPIHD